MAYTSIADIRLFTNLTTSDVSDENLTSIIEKVTRIINSKINVKVVREEIQYIDEVRKNERNGSNTTFYLKNWKGKYLADADNDAVVDKDDVIVYKIDTNNVESEVTVSSVVYDDMKIVLATAPTNSDRLFVTYQYSTLDPVTPDPLINLAATYLVCSIAFTKRDTGQMDVTKFGTMTLQRKVSESSATYIEKYNSVMRDIYSIISVGGNWKDSNIRI